MIKTILTILALSIPISAQSINQSFQREVILQRIMNGNVVQEHIRRLRFVRDDQGNLVEEIVYKTPNLKGISDDEIRDFAAGKPTRARPGIQMLARDTKRKEFRSTVEVQDVWDAHWPAGSRVKVYFSADFDKDLPVLIQALNTWNSLIPEVQFAYAGTAEQAQICKPCLTVLRNPSLGNGGRFEKAEYGDGLIVYGRINLGRTDQKTLFSVFAHEIGHGLGLDHADEGLMKEKLVKAKMVFPSQLEAALVRDILR